ncbi:two-component system chemotaxis response regulator CheY [Desulfitispora alkaliphila]|uniref:response regulator transcription factor n=1 Tax=Desulfitispora alkaliphila TaxID=622674 RepID=UPI003D23C7DA
MATKVLLVNDSKFERMVLKDILLQLGCNVVATDEYQAIDQLHSFSPNIAIANYNMSEITGDKLLTQLKERAPELTCFICSCSEIKLDNSFNNVVTGTFTTPTNPQKLQRILFSKTTTATNSCPQCTEKLDKGTDYSFCPYCGCKLK